MYPLILTGVAGHFLFPKVKMFSMKYFGVFLALVVAYCYHYYTPEQLDEIEEEKRNVVEAWQSIAKVPHAHFHRICVGYVVFEHLQINNQCPKFAQDTLT